MLSGRIPSFHSNFFLAFSFNGLLNRNITIATTKTIIISWQDYPQILFLWWHMDGMDGILDAIFLTLTTKYDVRLNQSFSPKVSEKKRRMKSDFQFKLISWLSDPAVKDLPEMTNDQCCAQFQLKCTDPLKCEFLHIRQKTQPL